jgi:hypothetical protein
MNTQEVAIIQNKGKSEQKEFDSQKFEGQILDQYY